MTTNIFIPDDRARSTIHDEMCPFVYEIHIVQRCFGRHEPDAEIPYEDYAQQRQWIASKVKENFAFHLVIALYLHFILMGGKSSKKRGDMQENGYLSLTIEHFYGFLWVICYFFIATGF